MADFARLFWSHRRDVGDGDRDSDAAKPASAGGPVPVVPVVQIQPSHKKWNNNSDVPVVPLVPAKMPVEASADVTDSGDDALFDAYEERAAIRVFDGGQPRAQAEAAAQIEQAQSAGITAEAFRKLLDIHRGFPFLDDEGLPCEPCQTCGGGDFHMPANEPVRGRGWHCTTCAPPPSYLLRHAVSLPCEPCRACGGGTFWKPAEAPLEGPGWQCSTCEPAPATQHRHAVALPTPGAKVPPIDSDPAPGDLGCTPDQIRWEVEARRRLYASRGIAAPIDQDHAIRSVAQTLGVTEQALRRAMGMAV